MRSSGNQVNGDVLPYVQYHTRVVVLAPHLNPDFRKLLNYNHPVCPMCLSSEFVGSNGWYDISNYVYDIDRHMWYMTFKYKCTNTIHKQHVFTLTDKAYELLPPSIKSALPIRPINRFWYSTRLIDYIIDHRLNTSLELIEKHITNSIQREFERRLNTFIAMGGVRSEFATTPYSSEYGESDMITRPTIQLIYKDGVINRYGDKFDHHFSNLTSDVYYADGCESFLRMSNTMLPMA